MPTTDVKEMFENVVHVGHRTQKWNPRMKKFIYGEKSGLHIIDLTKTVKLLDEALAFVKKSIADGKTVLFVSTKPQAKLLLEDTAKALKMPYVTNKWIPGLLTNFGTVKARIKYLKKMKEEEANGEFDKYTKKEIAGIKKEMAKLQSALGGVEDMKKTPDVVFVLDVCRDAIAVTESKKLSIPVVAVVDTNSNPENIAYPIPANDDSIKSIGYVLGKVSDLAK